MLDLLKHDYIIKTEERDITLSEPFETIYLFSEKSLKKLKEKNLLFCFKESFVSHPSFPELSLLFADKFPDKILDKTQLQRFLGSLNYVLDFCPNINRMSKPLHDRLKKNPVAWSEEHTKVVRLIKQSVKNIPCLFLANLALPKIVETDASDIGYGGILKQKENDKEQIVQYVSAH